MEQLATVYRNAQAPFQPTKHSAAAAAFHQSFTAEIADTDELRREVYRLRYQVYCAERGYEDPDQFAAGLEADSFDERASHALVRHRVSGLVVGVVRLISRGGAGESNFLPMEEASAHVFDPELLKQFDHTSQQVAEVSRFAVSKDAVSAAMRIAGHSAMYTVADDGTQLPAVAPARLIAWGLIAILFRMSNELGVDQWMALMERSLARHLSRLGIDFHGIGPIIDYHGKRQPMIANVDDLLVDIRNRRPDFYQLITSVFRQQNRGLNPGYRDYPMAHPAILY